MPLPSCIPCLRPPLRRGRRAAAIFLLLCAPRVLPALDIIAHRGASHDAPENTVASARLGWSQDADAVEIDIYLSRDGHIVVLHDPDTKRTTGMPGRVTELTRRELRALDAGAWKEARWKGERIPDLAEIVKTVPAGKRLFIEIKCGPEILPELQHVLRRSRLTPAQTVIIGFGYETMVEAKRRFPDFAVYWLSSFRQDPATGRHSPTVDELVRRAKGGGLTGISVQHRGPIDAGFVRTVKAAGLECHVWTVDDAGAARQLQDAGVDSITTNRPRWLRDQLAHP